jgi:hypothetical protein
MELSPVLESESAAIAALARRNFEREHPDAAASLGTSLDATFSRAVEALLDLHDIGEMSGWETCVHDLLAVEWSGAGTLLDVSLGLVRATCDRIIEVSQSDANDAQDSDRWIAVVEETGQRMACRLVELYQAHLETQG